jgi:hypothetical protein
MKKDRSENVFNRLYVEGEEVTREILGLANRKEQTEGK